MTALHDPPCRGPADCGGEFRCPRCRRVVGWCEAEGDMPAVVAGVCFDCWLRSHEIEARTLGARVRGAVRGVVRRLARLLVALRREVAP